jgi:hypothetical protein
MRVKRGKECNFSSGALRTVPLNPPAPPKRALGLVRVASNNSVVGERHSSSKIINQDEVP